ncbi:DUF6392 family protein [Pseudomonas baetica]|uniref:DUF6392 family protein n=1 Tax=Pseudomonas baetica TaxID=674054 RepID=UPI00287169E0|nr:DUF6392 family protein [Pseudomonas baetica]MDR9862453.1 DUF6392 family protein [Pseudomonas baetica]
MNIQRLIQNLGSSYHALIANEVIGNFPLQELYEDSDSLEIEPASGIELIFWPDTQSFEAIHITLSNDQDPSQPLFSGELPHPFGGLMEQSQVHNVFGEPMFSKGVMELLGTRLYGWDTYQLGSNLHPAATVDFQYGKDMKISGILFSLTDKHI